MLVILKGKTRNTACELCIIISKTLIFTTWVVFIHLTDCLALLSLAHSPPHTPALAHRQLMQRQSSPSSSLQCSGTPQCARVSRVCQGQILWIPNGYSSSQVIWWGEFYRILELSVVALNFFKECLFLNWGEGSCQNAVCWKKVCIKISLELVRYIVGPGLTFLLFQGWLENTLKYKDLNLINL